MCDRVTVKDLGGVLVRYERALASAGVVLPEGVRLAMDRGSKTYGVAYRVYVVGERLADGSFGGHGSGHANPPVGRDFLGMTAREAYDRLVERCVAIEDLVYARRDLFEGVPSDA